MELPIEDISSQTWILAFNILDKYPDKFEQISNVYSSFVLFIKFFYACIKLYNSQSEIEQKLKQITTKHKPNFSITFSNVRLMLIKFKKDIKKL